MVEQQKHANDTSVGITLAKTDDGILVTVDEGIEDYEQRVADAARFIGNTNCVINTYRLISGLGSKRKRGFAWFLYIHALMIQTLVDFVNKDLRSVLDGRFLYDAKRAYVVSEKESKPASVSSFMKNNFMYFNKTLVLVDKTVIDGTLRFGVCTVTCPKEDRTRLMVRLQVN